jgi:hypothetical protein
LRISAEPFCDPRQLTAIDDLIRKAPTAIGLRFGRACCLEDLGHIEESIQAYADVLGREPAHLGALTNLGSLLLERGFATDASAPRPRLRRTQMMQRLRGRSGIRAPLMFTRSPCRHPLCVRITRQRARKRGRDVAGTAVRAMLLKLTGHIEQR